MIISLSEYKALFDEYLCSYLDECSAKISPLLSHTPVLQTWISHAYAIATNEGKRVRPYFCYLQYIADGGTDLTMVLRIGVAIEMIHALALLVDDIIDHGTHRHGQKTLHTHIHAQGYDAVIAQMQTVLISDLYYNWVFRIFVDTIAPLGQAQRAALMEQIHSLLDEVLVGEMIDAAIQKQTDASPDLIAHKDYLKTASYTFIRPMMIGAYAAGEPSPQKKSQLHDFGYAMGCAYQIADDLGDITGYHTNKTTGSDMREGQQNTVTAAVLTHGSQVVQEYFLTIFGTNFSHSIEQERKQMLQKEQLLDIVQQRGMQYVEDAIALVPVLYPGDAVRIAYRQMITLIQKRLTV